MQKFNNGFLLIATIIFIIALATYFFDIKGLFISIGIILIIVGAFMIYFAINFNL